MDFYERIAAAFDAKGVNRAQVGRETGVSGQAVTLKLQRKSAVTPREIGVYAQYAGLTVSEALGEGTVVLELKDEQDLVELYRVLNAEQQRMILGLIKQLAATRPDGPPAAT